MSQTTEEKGLTLADQLLDTTPKPIDVRSLINTITNVDHAKAIATLYKRIKLSDDVAQDPADAWRPVRIMANGGKGEKAPDNSRFGDIFNETTGMVLDTPLVMFPLHHHVEYTKWGTGENMGKTLAKSLDGQTFKNMETGEYFDIESLDPKPGRFVSPKDSGYEYSICLYFTDKNFTNIFNVILKSYSIKECYDYLSKSTKQDTRFDPNALKKWFNLTTMEQKHNFGKSAVLTAKVSDVEMTEDEVRMVMFLKQVCREYYTAMLNARDEDMKVMKQRQENMQKLMDGGEVIDTSAKEVKDTGTTNTDVNASFNSLGKNSAL